jgi:prepilin-type N-terminal cleavage/methylation domain-containing protein
MRLVTSRKGFSLIELMVAIMVLVVALLGLAASSAAAIQMIGAGGRHTLAASVAQSRFELLRRGSCGTLTGGSAITRGMTEIWQIDSVRASAFVTSKVTYHTRRGPRTQTFRSVRPC